MAHEIRTPLTSLKLFLESIQGEIEIALEYEEGYRMGMEQIKRIESAINRFLDYSKPPEPVFTDIDVARLMGNELLMIKPLVGKQECGLNTAIEKDLPRIQGDNDPWKRP